jgi:hypothetical protein
MLGVPWQDCVELRSCHIFSLLMACVESMELAFHGKNQDPKMKLVIFDRLHMVMFMSINPYETIESFKSRGREIMLESFDNLQLGVVWTRYFWAYYYQLSK